MYRSQTTHADERIRAAHAALAERDHLTKVHAALAEEVASELKRIDELKTKLDAEERDVVRYERGVWAFLYNIFADRAARLGKEQGEAAEAAARYLEASASHEALRVQAAAIAERLEKFRDADRELALAREAKQALLISTGSPDGTELDGIVAQLGTTDAEARALDEAIAAGHRALAALQRLAEVLSSARNWGKADLLTDSFLISWAKRNKLDEARGLAGSAQAALQLFKTELADIGVALEAQIGDAADHHRFLDTWFDNIFSDFSVQDRIVDAQRTTSNAMDEVGGQIGRAQRRRDELAARVSTLNESRRSILDPG